MAKLLGQIYEATCDILPTAEGFYSDRIFRIKGPNSSLELCKPKESNSHCDQKRGKKQKKIHNLPPKLVFIVEGLCKPKESNSHCDQKRGKKQKKIHNLPPKLVFIVEGLCKPKESNSHCDQKRGKKQKKIHNLPPKLVFIVEGFTGSSWWARLGAIEFETQRVALNRKVDKFTNRLQKSSL